MLGASNNWYTGLNKNCPLETIITTEKECRLAASSIGFLYMGSNFVHTSYDRVYNYQAGCFGFLGTEGKTAYFNSIKDVLDTTPKYGSRGICREGVILFIISIISILSRTVHH